MPKRRRWSVHCNNGYYYKLYKKNPDIIDQQKQNILWVYRICHYALNENHDLAKEKIESLNKMFTYPLSTDLLIQTESAEQKNDKYKKKVGHHLRKITGLTWEQLSKYHIRRDFTAEERKEYDKNRYKGKLKENNSKPKSEQINEQAKVVQELVKEGKTEREIMEIFGFSRSKVKSLKKNQYKTRITKTMLTLTPHCSYSAKAITSALTAGLAPERQHYCAYS